MEYCEKICQESQLKIGKVIKMTGMNRTKYYDWKNRLGLDNNHNGTIPKSHWLTPVEKQSVIDYASTYITKNTYYLRDGYRRIAYMGLDENKFAVSPTSVYRILSKNGLLNKWQGNPSHKGTGFVQPLVPLQEVHTDIKYVNINGNRYYFISVLDGYSRYILHFELRVKMEILDVELTVERALEKYPGKKPKIISDNGGQYISKEFNNYMEGLGLLHVRTSVCYPQANGKIERFHRSLSRECLSARSMINLEDARNQIAKYIDHYNNHRLHSALLYLRPIDYLTGNIEELLKARHAKLDTAAEQRITYWRDKNNLQNIMNSCKFDMPDEAESGNAGEQPARNNQADWNGLGVGENQPQINQHSKKLSLRKLKLKRISI